VAVIVPAIVQQPVSVAATATIGRNRGVAAFQQRMPEPLSFTPAAT